MKKPKPMYVVDRTQSGRHQRESFLERHHWASTALFAGALLVVIALTAYTAGVVP